jgi:hypothetical protein
VSKSIYTVTFDTSDVIREIERIKDQLERTSIEVGQNRRNKLAGLDWRPVSRQFGNVQIPARMFEITVPPEFTEDAGIRGETALVSIQEHGISMTLTDASLPTTKCDEVAARLAKKIYEEATGITLRPEQVVVRATGIMASTICEYCKEAVESFPYRCRICGRCFCYDHKNPTIHGCQVKAKAENEDQGRNRTTRPSRAATKSENQTRPSVIVTRVPCG